jgi:hypothetical protein
VAGPEWVSAVAALLTALAAVAAAIRRGHPPDGGDGDRPDD